MKLRSSRILVISLFLFLTTIECAAKVAPMPLKELIQKSQAIVIGRVVKIMTLKSPYGQEDNKIAELEIKQVIKGTEGEKRLYFWASPTWTCDISDARINEDVLLFLGRFSRESMTFSSPIFQGNPEILKKLLDECAQKPLYHIGASGGGRMEIIERNMLDSSWYVEMPSAIKKVKDRRSRSKYREYYSLPSIIYYIIQGLK